MVQTIIQPAVGLQKPFGSLGPQGVTIHYAADRNVDRCLNSLKEQDLRYHLIIDRTGAVIQAAYLTHAVNHAGKAMWHGLSPNQHHLAICLMSWGYVEKIDGNFVAWNGTKLDPKEVVERPDNIDGKKWFWDAATPIQEQKLEEVCRWLMVLGISVHHFCGHDEAALPKGRKYDIGGVLSKTMNQFRHFLTARGSYVVGNRNT
jgi:N-acetyl-anhydromuramyl-L-alanine amidase AmpD